MTAGANPLININLEDQVVYDNFEASAYSYNTTIGPISGYKSVIFIDNYMKVHLNIPKDDIGYYIKPINSVKLKYYYSTEDILLEGKSGTKLSKGSNLFLFEDG